MKQKIIGLIVLFLIAIIPVQAQETIFEDALAYIREDNNVYLTDFESTLALTDDAFGNPGLAGGYIIYDSPTWSTDGQMLIFYRSELSVGTSLIVMRSGESPKSISLSEHDIYVTEPLLAISPDSSEIALFGYNADSGDQGVFKLSLEDETFTFLILAMSSGIGEPNSVDPAINLTMRATGRPLYREQFALAWGEAGILYTPTGELFAGLRLINPEGDVLWTTENLHYFLLAPDGDYALGYVDEGWYDIDLNTGEGTLLDLPDDAKPIGWIGGQLYYRTQSNIITVATREEIMEGVEIYDWDWGYFDVSSATNTIFAHYPDDEDVLIADISGYDIGMITGNSINYMLVRYVSSSIPAVVALNEGAEAEDVAHLTAKTTFALWRLAYKQDSVRALLQGNVSGKNGAYGIGEFVISS